MSKMSSKDITPKNDRRAARPIIAPYAHPKNEMNHPFYKLRLWRG